MSEFTPVFTAEDLDALDTEEIVEGYMAGLRGDGEPGSGHGRAYWHGWRNGMVDSGRASLDAAQAQLAHALYGPARRMGMH